MKRDWKKWLLAALVRAVRTFAESMLAYIGTGAVVLGDVNWIAALSAGAFGFVVAILLALVGLPEVKEEEETKQVEDATPINIADDAPVLIAETGEEKTYAEIKAEEIELWHFRLRLPPRTMWRKLFT